MFDGRPKLSEVASAVLLASASVLAACSENKGDDLGALKQPTPTADRAVETEKTQATNPVQQELQKALQYISTDPTLASFVKSVFQLQGPRAKFELVSDIPALAASFGEKGFIGDAFTVSMEKRPPSGPSTFVHVISLAETSFSSTGKLVVVLAHELLHMQRRELGIPMNSTKDEEIAVFTEGISLAERIALRLTSNVGATAEDKKVASDIIAALATDRGYLQDWIHHK